MSKALWPARSPSAPPTVRSPTRLARWLLLVVITGLTPALLWGCSRQTKYEVLSFFFDGVPAPDGTPAPVNEPSPWDVPSARARLAIETTTDPTQLAAAPVQFFFHMAYSQRKCEACHGSSAGFEPAPHDSSTCRSCHADHFDRRPEDWVHGAAVDQRCDRCHLPHKSEHKGLLVDAQPALCFNCHEEKLVREDPYHAAIEDLTCSNCHDPHAAGNRLLLVDARTYGYRARPEKTYGVHSEWGRDTCSRCHVPEQSNQLQESVDHECQKCHAQAMAAVEGQPLHEAVTQGKCTVCHTAHRSDRPKLVRMTAEEICYACHTLEDVRKPGHPNVTRADCLLCHVGHRGNEPKLLKPNVMAGLHARGGMHLAEGEAGSAGDAMPASAHPERPQAEDRAGEAGVSRRLPPTTHDGPATGGPS